MFTTTESSPIKSAQVPEGFWYSLNSAQVKNSTAKENFNMLVLHVIMWRRRCCCKRQNMWVHLINIKIPEFRIFSHLYPGLLEDEEKFHGFFRMNIEQFYCLSQLVGEEIRKQNTNYRRAISPENDLQFF